MVDQYLHQTYNHLTFDQIRAIQMGVKYLTAYLQVELEHNYSDELAGIVGKLEDVSDILFDGVYKPIRRIWL